MKRVAYAAVGISVGLAVAYQVGGGRDPKRPSPTAPKVDAQTASTVSASGKPPAFEVVHRLVEELGGARVEVSSETEGAKFLSRYWRKMRPAWAKNPVKEVTSLAVRVSEKETVYSRTLEGGREWKPDVQLWNMNEGSFDQREALVAPAPSSYKFTFHVPPNARFETAAGVPNEPAGKVRFLVSVAKKGDAAKVVSETAFGGHEGRGWHEVAVDLAEFAGAEVVLELKTEVVPPAGEPSNAGTDPEVVESRLRRPRPIGPTGEVFAPTSYAGLWGNPVVLASRPPVVPYNVLWVVVDALRPDVIAALHDDAEDALAAQKEPNALEARLPKVPGLMPNLDALATKASVFTHAYSAASWTRPGTIAMLAGAPSSAIGIDATRWVSDPSQIRGVYGKSDPFLGAQLRRQGVFTAGFVNNFFMAGYTPIGIDMGFERLVDHRYRTADTDAITRDADTWIRGHKQSRFFAFVNYNSPHDPIDPLPEFLAKVPGEYGNPKRPLESHVRGYMAEAAKDDRAIGTLLKTLEETGLLATTIVVVTADHGETLSQAHVGKGLEDMQTRFHHAVGDFEETTRIPLFIYVPNKAPRRVATRVSSIDIVPTLTALLGASPPENSQGVSLSTAIDGGALTERPIYSEGRGIDSVLDGKFHYITRANEKTGRLYDLDRDPGERMPVTADHPVEVARLTALLEEFRKGRAPKAPGATTSSEPNAAGSSPLNRPASPASVEARVLVRFSAGGQKHHVEGELRREPSSPGLDSTTVSAVGLPPEAWVVKEGKLRFAFDLGASAVAGFDLRGDLTLTGNVRWDGSDASSKMHLGPYALGQRPARLGGPRDAVPPAGASSLTLPTGTGLEFGPALPELDGSRDMGIFVVKTGQGASEAATGGAQGAAEMDKVLRDWGYAH